MSDLERLNSVSAKVNLTAVIDSSGRGGNLFFLTLFDLHPEVACCPIVQYSYSYILAEFGDSGSIDAVQAHHFLCNKSYFRLLYNDSTPDNDLLFERMGGTPSAVLDRPRLRQLIDAFFAERIRVTRKELIVAPLVAHALIRGVAIEKLRYVLIGDAISRRTESVQEGFSGSIIDRIVEDFPEAKISRLMRDPRATFASPRHQFVNSLGNMYAVKPGNYLSRLLTLISGGLTPENGCVYLYWLLYLKQAENAVLRKEAQYPEHFMVIKNEELNLSFVDATQRISNWLGVDRMESWNSTDFVPTVIGVPWKGAGAYNSRYQRATTGLLPNDPEEVSLKVTGPNEYVTRRWRTRLNRREIVLIEYLFARDLQVYGYEFLTSTKDRSPTRVILSILWGPFEGELPTWVWLKKGFAESWKEGSVRLFYAFSFPPFYIASRLKLLQYRIQGLL